MQSYYNVTNDDIIKAINVLKELEPCGVGARNVKECLSFQLEMQGKSDSLEMKLIQNHLEKLAEKRYEKIAREENVDIKQIYEALRNIKALEPYPGREFSDETINYITPDIFILCILFDHLLKKAFLSLASSKKALKKFISRNG